MAKYILVFSPIRWSKLAEHVRNSQNMPVFRPMSLSWVLGSDIYLYQETLYRSESCKRKLRKTSPCGPPGMATRVHPTYRQRYSCYAIVCRSLLHFLQLFCLSFIIGMPNRSCILKLRMNQCFVCSFLCVPRCKSQIAPKKTQCLSCFTRNF